MAPCCAPGCRSNYKGGKFMTTFKFPSNPELREKWMKCLPRKNWTCTKNSSLCILHFRNEDVRSSIKYVDSDGSEKSISSAKLRLKTGALPSIWPGLPPGLLPPIVKKRATPAERLATREDRAQTTQSGALQTDAIESYAEFASRYNAKLQPQMVANKWFSVSGTDCIVFFIMSVIDIPMPKVSLKVQSNLGFSRYIGITEMNRDESCKKIEKWSQMADLLNSMAAQVV